MMNPVRLALGTVQFGLAYGIAGRGAAVPDDEIRTILEVAADAGVWDLDTAPGYGTIESRLAGLLGSLDFRVISKIPGLPAQCSTAAQAAAFVRASVEESRSRLGSRLAALLFHRPEDLFGPFADAAWQAADCAAGGQLNLGVSGYGPHEVIELRRRYPITITQLPGNAFDQRLAEPAVADELRGVEIHLRSVFLQGLLLMTPDRAAERIPAAGDSVRAWHAWCANRKIRPITAALAIARQLPGVRLCVVGVDHVEHLKEILAAWAEAEPCHAPALACTSIDVVDPRRWATA